MNDPLLECEDLTIQYETQQGRVSAVSDASFAIQEKEYFGLVGESGCGKSTIAKAIVGGLDANGQITSGTLRYRGEEIQDYSDQRLNKEIRWKEISLIPQSSMNSLDPLLRIKDQAIKIARRHTDMTKEEALDRTRELFDIVGLQESRIADYPHQFSGGMQQRAIIALALLLEPALIIADEPTTALDVIMQDQILKHLEMIREETNTSMLFITHDISVILETCDRMAIMHSGQIAESGSVTDLYDTPSHPYSVLLQRSLPDYRFPDRELAIIDGTPPELYGEVDFCTFADRCDYAVEECRARSPDLEPVEAGDDDHVAACVRKEDVLADTRREQFGTEAGPSQ